MNIWFVASAIAVISQQALHARCSGDTELEDRLADALWASRNAMPWHLRWSIDVYTQRVSMEE